MFTVDVTPVFMPVKVNVSARALVPANDSIINAPKARIPLVRNLFIFLIPFKKSKDLCAPLELFRHRDLFDFRNLEKGIMKRGFQRRIWS